MAERIRRGQKYNRIVEIGDAAQKNLDQVKRERNVKFLPIKCMRGHQDRRIDRYRYLRRDKADIERQELQEGLKNG
ncbi:unnamed protein product [Cylicocyclus nassatus]|uniref:Uncharacterized protein n=1 Tax=Cylicocyclus nassatus TaxID=53992 RepID=A0AA36GYD1_CYLNA|nr:unnamed protein product [Cylicocyclus nassatus]CAJ0600655.1 unnamed protein product [Cylicocyclus nassatus]